MIKFYKFLKQELSIMGLTILTVVIPYCILNRLMDLNLILRIIILLALAQLTNDIYNKYIKNDETD